MSRTTKPANSIEEKMAKMVAEEFDARVKEICSPTYYKNQYLKYAFQHHATPQCITRTYLEMLKSGREFSGNANDMKHLSYALERLIMVTNSDFIEFLSDTREVLKKETRKKYPYLIMDAPGRIKSFKSSEVKIRSKLLKDEVLKDTLSNLSSYGLESEEEEAMAKEYLLKELKLNASSCIGDTFGIRFIIYSFERKTDEVTLVKFAFEYSDFVKNQLELLGFSIMSETDYISNPKDNGYQSIHIKANYAGINLEIQIRTAGIHKHAENGSAAYDEYKNTEIQNFTKSFLYKISGNAVEQNEKLGLLKETTLDPTFWAFTPADEIPQTPDKLKTFEDMALLKKIFE